MTDPPAATEADVRLELERLAEELAQADTPKHRAEIHRLADKWLDERLSQQGAHSPGCRCQGCLEFLDPIIARCTHLGEVAAPEEWGAAG